MPIETDSVPPAIGATMSAAFWIVWSIEANVTPRRIGTRRMSSSNRARPAPADPNPDTTETTTTRSWSWIAKNAAGVSAPSRSDGTRTAVRPRRREMTRQVTYPASAPSDWPAPMSPITASGAFTSWT